MASVFKSNIVIKFLQFFISMKIVLLEPLKFPVRSVQSREGSSDNIKG